MKPDARRFRWASAGARVVVGSRDADRGARVARFLGLGNARGGGVGAAVAAADVVLLCVPPGRAARAVVEAHGAALAGRAVVDLSRSYEEGHPPPAAFEDSLRWLATFAPEGVRWAKAVFPSALDVRDAPALVVEVCGDDDATALVARLCAAVGWEALDRGGRDAAPLLEAGGARRAVPEPRRGAAPP